MARRASPLLIALTGIGALTAVLAVDSARSSYRHAATTQHVLEDYAALGAEGVTSRLQATLGTRFVQVLNALSAGEARRDSLLGALPAPAAAVARMIRWSGRLERDSLAETTGDTSMSPSRGFADSVRAVRARLNDAAYVGAFATERELVVFSPNPSAATASVFAIGLDSLSRLLTRNVSADPVLPRALTRGETLGEQLGVQLSVNGTKLVRRGIDSSSFHASSALGPMLGNIAVDVYLAESLAPTLVIGGLPRSRLPFLLAALALTAALVTVMVMGLRQRDRLARLREDFVASTSHELRTPLAQIRLFAETLRLERVRSDDERTRALTVIEREARRLEHLVDNMLHSSRMERGTLQLSPTRVDIGALTSEVVTDFLPLAEKHDVVVRMHRGAPAHAMVDPDSWRQIVINLLDNAVRYGGQESHVDIAVSARDGNVQLRVSDDGPGIPPADRDRVWHRFWRGDAARNSAVSGAGIGLATVRELVRAHGGRCHVADAKQGARGATIVVDLPVAPEVVT
jgi:signal transduction histidine kinase